MPQLDFSTYPSQLFWLVISFAALYFVLAVFVLPRLTQVQTLRAENTSGKRLAAQTATEEAEKALTAYETFIAEGRVVALKEATALRTETDKRLTTQMEQVRGRLESEAQAATHAVRTFLTDSQSEVATAANQLAQDIFQKLTARQ